MPFNELPSDLTKFVSIPSLTRETLDIIVSYPYGDRKLFTDHLLNGTSFKLAFHIGLNQKIQPQKHHGKGHICVADCKKRIGDSPAFK